MHRTVVYVGVFLLITLSACAAKETPKPSTLPEASAAAPSAIAASEPAATAPSSMGCSVIAAKPTAQASQGLPPITAADYVRGPEPAPVTLLAYCDFQSAQCEIFARALDQLVSNHPNDLRVALRPFPVPTSVVPSLDKSQISVQAAIAAGDQGKFWEMRDLLHKQYATWTPMSSSGFEQWVEGQAEGLGMDRGQFAKGLISPATIGRADAMFTSASTLGITGLPTVFINGNLQQRAGLSYEGLDATIGLIALGTRQFKTCPPFEVDPTKQYTAAIHTEKGEIELQLFADKAPLAVNSFIFLARHGWYNGVTFHRVIPGFIAQAGDPSGTGSGGPGYYFRSEIVADLTFNKPGMVGLANSGPDTNGSQFFITYTPQPKLDGTFTIFAQVIKGMDVVEDLTMRDPQQNPGSPPGDKILSVTIEEK